MEERKEIIISVPEGYEIDKENSTFERIKFKKKDELPKTWEDYCKRVEDAIAYYSSTAGKCINNRYARSSSSCYDSFKTAEEADAFTALGKLIQLRDAWIGDWKPNWTPVNSKVVIAIHQNNIEVMTRRYCHCLLSFPTIEMAQEFCETFKDLIETAKMFL